MVQSEVPYAASDDQRTPRRNLVALLLVGVACALVVVALTAWAYVAYGRDSDSWCRSGNGGLKYTCVGGVAPENGAARGCEAQGGAQNVVEWRCVRPLP